MRPPISDPGIATKSVHSEPLVIALPQLHGKVGRGSVALSDPAHEPFIICSREATQYCYDMTLAVCRGAGFVPIVHHDGDHPQALLTLVGLGLGIALVPQSHGLVESPGVVFRPLRRRSRKLETLLAWRRDTNLIDVECLSGDCPTCHNREPRPVKMKGKPILDSGSPIKKALNRP